MNRAPVLLTLGAALAIGAVLGAARAEAPPGSEYAPLHAVLTSPRCQNCHPAGDAPRVGDEQRPHRMNVSRRSPDAGLPCAACHRTRNAPMDHGPPGVPGWRMPPAEHPMPFERRTAHELCEQLKDPGRNGGKTLAELRVHFATDPIVLWAWSPGPGRATPPLPHAALVQAVDLWLARGAPCPP
jgi:hypothetical protein